MSLFLYLLVVVHPTLLTLTLVLLATGLAFGWRISVRDPMAAVVLVAFNATLIVFGSSLASDQGSFSVWITRLTQFLLAGAFAIGMMALMWPRDAELAEVTPAATAQ